MPALTPRDLGFPLKFSNFREGQADTIVDLLSSPHGFSLVRGPTGAGKTAINMGLAKALGARVLYLVVSKALQNQLTSDWSPMGLVDTRGHSNYPCADISLDETGELADFECSMGGKSGCGYWPDIDEALRRQFVTTNYAHWVTMALAGAPDRLGQFDLLVCDEAHNLVFGTHFTDLLSVKLHRVVLDSLLGKALPLPRTVVPDDLEFWVAWCEGVLAAAVTRYREEKSKAADAPAGSTNPRMAARTLARLKKLAGDLDRFLVAVRDDGLAWAVAEHTPRLVRLSPVFAGDYTHSHLFRGIPRVVLCSATLDKRDAARLAIDAASSDFRELPSTFPASKRPFYYIPTSPPLNIDRRMTEGEFTLMVRQRIDQVIEGRLDRKGIIHARSYQYAEQILRQSKFREIMVADRRGRPTAEALRAYEAADPPCVLVSPAVSEGHDFPDDLARYQIILKVPYVYAKDPVLKARAARDRSYLIDLAGNDLQQTAGRIIRSVDDFGETFIFDAHFGHFRNQARFPGYFRAAWRQLDRIPAPPPLGRRKAA